MKGSETLASPTAEVWISFLFPHRSVLTSVFHFRNDYQVRGQNFSLPFFLPSGNADSSICEKCPCVFEFRLRYLTSASTCSNSSQSWHWVTPEPGIPFKEASIFSDLGQICQVHWKILQFNCFWVSQLLLFWLDKNLQCLTKKTAKKTADFVLYRKNACCLDIIFTEVRD